MELIDILNMISKGELKEGTKIMYKDIIYNYKNGNVFDPKSGFGLMEDIYEENLNDELELIEAECKHEWKKYSLGRLGGITENHRRCKKCGIDEIEDVGKMANNTYEIEELIADEINGKSLAEALSIIGGKLNEVIRYINRR